MNAHVVVRQHAGLVTTHLAWATVLAGALVTHLAWAEPATIEPLHGFSGPDGSRPAGALLSASDGNFYGTTQTGGAAGSGTVFQLTPAGTLTPLYAFSGGSGTRPSAALIEGSDGNFYGTTSISGTTDNGTVYRFAADGSVTVLHSFSGPDGARSAAALIEANDGNFYGTTTNGGAAGLGTLFRLTPDGSLTTLHSFSGFDGANPQAALLQGSDGNLYGTTRNGGEADFGTVFRITPSGELTQLHVFSSGFGTGAYPTAPLIEASDGNFYGTTSQGSDQPFVSVCPFVIGCGTVFRITPEGTLTTIHAFNGSDGEAPGSALLQASDGYLYGTTSYGGRTDDGTLFRVSPDGAFATLHMFNGADGAIPTVSLVEADSGRLLGATYFGGVADRGSVYAINVPAGVFLTVLRTGTGSGTVTSTPASIDCGDSCSNAFAPGSEITLTASPAAGSAFTGWDGICTGTGTGSCTLTLAEDTNLSATFTNMVPNDPNLIAPKGRINTKTPTYRWHASEYATAYTLLVLDSSGLKILQNFTAAEANCVNVGSECSVTPANALASGTGNWRVRATNSFGVSPWSTPLFFRAP